VEEFKIFDRWGGMRYQATNFKSDETKYAWDGYSNGKRVDTGVFVYFIKYKDAKGKEHVLAGDVAVIY